MKSVQNQKIIELDQLMKIRNDDFCINDETCLIPEDSDFIQDHQLFEERRKQLIEEYEKKLKDLKSGYMFSMG